MRTEQLATECRLKFISGCCRHRRPMGVQIPVGLPRLTRSTRQRCTPLHAVSVLFGGHSNHLYYNRIISYKQRTERLLCVCVFPYMQSKFTSKPVNEHDVIVCLAATAIALCSICIDDMMIQYVCEPSWSTHMANQSDTWDARMRSMTTKHARCDDTRTQRIGIYYYTNACCKRCIL